MEMPGNHRIRVAWCGIALLLLVVWSCAPAPTVKPPPDILEPGGEVWVQAEQLYEEGAIEEARPIFEQYVTEFPTGSYAPAALMRLGDIYSRLDRPDQSIAAYQRVAADYPDNPMAADALIALIRTFYLADEYQKALEIASDLIQRPVSERHIYLTYILLGDIHLAIEAPQDAVTFYTMAYDKASESDKENTVAKLKQAVRQLQTEDIVTLLNRLSADLPVSYLLYQLALNAIEEKDYGDAISALDELAARFPGHEYAPDALALIDELKTSYVYQRDVIGVLLPLSGSYRPYGVRALQGIELALFNHNQRPGALPIRLMVRDTGADPGTAVEMVQEMFREQVAIIIGPIIAAEAAAAEAEALGIPILTLTQKDGIPELGNFVFRNFLTPRMQVETMVSYAVQELGIKRFAVLYPDENYGDTFMNLFWDQVVKQGGQVVGLESYPVDQTDFAKPIKKLVGLHYPLPKAFPRQDAPVFGQDAPVIGLDAVYLEEMIPGQALPREESEESNTEPKMPEDEGPKAIVDFEAVFLPDAPTKAGLIIPQLAYYDIHDVYLMGTNLWHSDKLLEMAGDYMEGALVAEGFYADSRFEIVRQFVTDFESVYGRKPRFIEAVGFDTAGIVFDTVDRISSDFRSGLKLELLGLNNYAGVTGLTSFDEGGEAKKQLTLLQIHRNRFKELDPFSMETPPVSPGFQTLESSPTQEP